MVDNFRDVRYGNSSNHSRNSNSNGNQESTTTPSDRRASAPSNTDNTGFIPPPPLHGTEGLFTEQSRSIANYQRFSNPDIEIQKTKTTSTKSRTSRHSDYASPHVSPAVSPIPTGSQRGKQKKSTASFKEKFLPPKSPYETTTNESVKTAVQLSPLTQVSSHSHSEATQTPESVQRTIRPSRRTRKSPYSAEQKTKVTYSGQIRPGNKKMPLPLTSPGNTSTHSPSEVAGSPESSNSRSTRPSRRRRMAQKDAKQGQSPGPPARKVSRDKNAIDAKSDLPVKTMSMVPPHAQGNFRNGRDSFDSDAEDGNEDDEETAMDMVPGAYAVDQQNPRGTRASATGLVDSILINEDPNEDHIEDPIESPTEVSEEDENGQAREAAVCQVKSHAGNEKDKDTTKSSKTKLIAIIVGVLLLIGIGAGVGAALGGGKGGAEESIPTQAPTMPPTLAPTIGVDLAPYQAIVHDLTTNATAFEDIKSPQYMALLWMGLRYEDSELPEEDVLRQEYALAVFYYSTNGPSWRTQAGFLEQTDVCDWIDPDMSNGLQGVGVDCNGAGDVVALFLRMNELEGTIPDELAAVSTLELLLLGGNSLSGTIPGWIFDTSSIIALELRDNDLTGTVPSNVGFQTTLRVLELSNNLLQGPLSIEPLLEDPDCRLASLMLSNNDFEGRFNLEATAQNCASLIGLELRNSGLSVDGTFPSVGFERLERLDLRQAGWTGTIPDSIGRMTLLEALRMSFNSLEGTIPSTIGDLTNLQLLDLAFNQLDGELPTSMGELQQLSQLVLTGNFLEGPVPIEIAQLPSLQLFELQQNFFNGRPRIPVSSRCGTSSAGSRLS